MNAKIRNLTRRRSKFEPGEAGAEAAQPEQVERCKRASKLEIADDVRNQFLSLF
ncbi:putative uncharacterized protein [Waddlia chondrophila 2032/99]|uniref:Uncharacterized protein n=2 Tax=Waddlia chondrophila TaxID=71667 RepID=D6YW61_WADCW|nr:hypothetical protein [Waddlia chondrophila]ADI38372.1 hypothetical protein wcw_1013 [Waddlia chondrophila WSU 86-1044]CCB91459.1 putative uncharacterized protein [Waddlia chondrophila 2032/99]